MTKPHSTTVSATDFESVDSGSSPDVAANITASEIELHYQNLPPLSNPLEQYLVDRTFAFLRERGLIP